jgi:ABC-type branched-subunit amino acid transport system ATPase component/branched-subunit amino acid ABC-type transport system permease component
MRGIADRIRSLPKNVRLAILAVAVALFILPRAADVGISVLLSLGNMGAYAILAVGIVMIYRASKVLNLAHGAMVMFPPYVVKVMVTGGVDSGDRYLAALIPAVAVGPLIASLLIKRGVPRVARLGIGTAASLAAFIVLVSAARSHLVLPLALVVGLAAGASLGYLVERIFVRTLRAQGPTAQTVGTVAALGLVVAFAAKIFGTAAENSVSVFPDGGWNVSNSFIRYGEVGLFAIAGMVTVGLILLFTFTDLGLVMRGTAENRRAASLMGIDPDRITALTWIIGGLLAGFSGILLASVTNLQPYVLSLQALPAFVAALLGGMASMLGAVGGSALVAITLAIAPAIGLDGIEGAPQLFLAVAAIVAMVSRGQRITGGEVRTESLAAQGARTATRGLGGLAECKRPLVILGILAFIAFPFTPFASFSLISNLNAGAANALVAASLVILIGWVGQISLGHAAIVGVGAYATGWVAQGMGIPFPLSLPLAALAAASLAVVLGIVAVRVRGLFLAVATLIFSWMGSEFLFRQQWFIKHFKIDDHAIGEAGTFPSFDFTDPRMLFYAAWALVGLGLIAAANLRDSKTGRAFFAVQGSEMAAASLGIDVAKYKLLAFGISGFLAGAAGSLRMSDLGIVSPDGFAFQYSLLFVAIAVVGGLRSLGGAVAAGILFALLEQLFFEFDVFAGYLEVVSAALLAVVLLAYPGGLAGLGNQLAQLIGRQRWIVAPLKAIDRTLNTLLADITYSRRRTRARLEAHRERAAFEDLPLSALTPSALNGHEADAELEAEPEDVTPHVTLPPNREDREIVVRSEHVTVRFGGLTAVNDVSMEVRRHEIVGLIGPNGAGKTVSFNSIAGIVVPTEGHIQLHGEDVTNAPVHLRAQLGIARTFQALQLFPGLSIFDNLLVATHMENPTGFLAHAVASGHAVDAEAVSRAQVKEVVELLGLGDVTDRFPGDLPFGTLRLVEVARAMVTGLDFIMLDESASGLDDNETERLIQAFLKVRDAGKTLLVIEHDVKMIMRICDYVYVLDRGTLIAEGTPSVVQRDPAVIAAYLGAASSDEPAEATV